MFVSLVPRPTTPLAGIHTVLAGYFPDRPNDGPRERLFLWRGYDAGRLVMLSRTEPATACAAFTVVSSRVYPFIAELRRTKHCGKNRREVTIEGNDNLRAWLSRATEAGGGKITYATFRNPRTIKFQKNAETIVRLETITVSGLAQIVDAPRFADFLAGGGPGTGKPYGLGMWWLPETMDPALARIREQGAAA